MKKLGTHPCDGLVVVLLLALATSWLIFARAVAVESPLKWDEASHSLAGLLIFDDLVRSRFVSLVFDTYTFVWWPPLHPWYLALFFTCFGPSTLVARSSTLVALVGVAVMVYLTARELRTGRCPHRATDPECGRCLQAANLGGLVAAGSLLAASGVQLLASMTMLEVPALFWLTLSFWLYGRCWRATGRLGARAPVLLGLSVLVTYLTRSSYGVLLALALTATFLFDGNWLGLKPAAARKRSKPNLVLVAARRRGQLRTALTLAIPLAAWLAHPQKVSATLSALLSVPIGPERFSIDGLLFYPRATLWLAGSWPLLIAWLIGFGLILQPRLIRSDGRLRFLAIFLGLQLLLAEVHVNKEERNILPLALGFSLLVGYWTSQLWMRWNELAWPPLSRPVGLAAGAFVAVGALALAVSRLPDVVTASRPGSPVPVPTLLEYLVQDIRQHRPSLILASWADAPNEIDWHLASRRLLDLDGAGSLVSENDMRFVDAGQRRVPAFLPRSIGPQLNRYPGAAGPYTAYLGHPLGAPPALVFTTANFRQHVSALLTHHPVDRVLIVTRSGSTLTSEFVEEQMVEIGFVLAPSEGVNVPETEVRLVAFSRT